MTSRPDNFDVAGNPLDRREPEVPVELGQAIYTKITWADMPGVPIDWDSLEKQFGGPVQVIQKPSGLWIALPMTEAAQLQEGDKLVTRAGLAGVAKQVDQFVETQRRKTEFESVDVLRLRTQPPALLDTPFDEPGYEMLAAVLVEAYNQAAKGKGKERHAQAGEPFDQQVMADGAKRFGTGALLFQAYKKAEESQRMDLEPAVRELLGGIVYLAGAVLARRRTGA